MISRTIPIGTLNEIEVAMQKAPLIFKDDATKVLYTVLNSNPRTEMKNRVPLATTARYSNYIGANGKAKKVNRNVSGSVGTLYRAADNGVRTVSTGVVEFGIRAGSRIPYARRVHDMKKPREGEYWQPGMRGFGHGWTTAGTGNKYVERPVRHNAKWIPETFHKQLDRRLKRAGL